MKTLLRTTTLLLGIVAPSILSAQTEEAASVTEVQEIGNAPSSPDKPSLPDKITVTEQTKVIVKQDDGTTGSAVLPKGAEFTPTGLEGNKLTVKLENGHAEIDISATNYKEASAKLNDTASSAEDNIKIGESVTLDVEVGPKIPGGFLSTKRKIDGGTVQENIAVIGMPNEQLQEGEWWSGPARKLGHYTPDEGDTVYMQYQASPRFGVKTDPPPGDKPNAPEVTFAEIKQLYESLNLEQWLTTTNGISNNINERGTYQIDANKLLSLGVKKEQVNYIVKSIPNWNKAAETAKDWIDNRNMQPSYTKLCELIIKANDLLGPNSISTMRNYVKGIERQWQTIQAIDGKSPVPEPDNPNITP